MKGSSGAATGPKIRTLLFSTLYPNSVRPSHGIFVETRLRHLIADGRVDTRVMAPVPWFPSTAPAFGRWAQWAATPYREIRNGIEVFHPRYPLPPYIGMSVAPLLLALGARRQIARLIASGFDFDLIDAHYYYPDGIAAALLAKWFGKPFVVTARGSDLTQIGKFAIPQRWIRWTAARAGHSIAVCQSLIDSLEELGGDIRRAVVLRNGVDLERFQPHNRAAARGHLGLPDGQWLVVVGHLVELKGHAIAIEALARLPGVRLGLVGDGPERDRLQALAEQLGVAERVHFAGERSQAELPYWYSAADASLLCSSREGWANVLLESMACGTPVAATAVGGTPEVLRSPVAGRLIDDRSAAGVVAAVSEVLAAPASRDEVRRYAEQFDWAETSAGQFRLFESAVRSFIPQSQWNGRYSHNTDRS